VLKGRHEVERLRKRLDSAYKRYDLVGKEEELRSDFARYLCVLTSGYLEQSVYYLLTAFAQGKAHPSVLRFVDSELNRFQNPNIGKICDLLEQFDPSWKAKVEAFAVSEIKDAVGSIVSTRHGIAHGESTGITFSQLKSRYEKLQELVIFLTQLLDPPT
jgi:RiboL-PSP-HEPN